MISIFYGLVAQFDMESIIHSKVIANGYGRSSASGVLLFEGSQLGRIRVRLGLPVLGFSI